MQPATVRTCMRVAMSAFARAMDRWAAMGWPGQSGSLRSLFCGSSGFHPRNKFSGCDRILCTCSLENSVGVRGKCMSELNLGLLNALKYHWCETIIISNCLIRVVSKDFIFKKSVQGNGMHSQATTIDCMGYLQKCMSGLTYIFCVTLAISS